eukprot:CAMPEP_0198513030 /NCGR_PEP_ID=MMETSP1462-20131121/15813_1 /TAXON_ID=1333877 /ORGANISM="Brandtodinium nutriculum, Strain RCC3387" /LENGTH=236 /DNA_ID=CAMNT_0044242451 /DNA_START=63 /DNA_END=770 /DNA_ORIENTATION=-
MKLTEAWDAWDPTRKHRMGEELRALQALGSHEGITSLLDYCDSTFCSVAGISCSMRLVLDLCEGGNLLDRMMQLKRYAERDSRLCCTNLMCAVAYIHSKGIMHRDLRLEDILLTSTQSNSDVKISSFGLAKLARDSPECLPRSWSICGNVFFRAPEVIRQEEYGREVDMWALGVIAYVLLSGRLPFSEHGLYRRIIERRIEFPEQHWRDVSETAIDLIMRLLLLRAGDRLTAEQAL